MNICIFAKSTLAHRMGGMEIHGDLLSKGLAARGHQVVVITTRHPEGLIVEERDCVQTYYFPESPSALYSRAWWRGSIAKFTELARGIEFDVLISQSVAAYAYCRNLKKEVGLPLVAFMQGTPLGELRSVWNQVQTAQELFFFFTKIFPDILLRSIPWFRCTLDAADVVVAASHQLADDLRREFPFVAEKLTTILNGVDTTIFYPDEGKRTTIRKKFSIALDEKLILMAGRLDKQKGMDDGLQAFARLRSSFGRVKLIMVGEGPFRMTLERLAEILEIQRDVIFTGPVVTQEMPGYYNACDVFLNPTRRMEGLPFVIAEAMACGRPIVSTKIGGTPSAIEDGINGFLVAPGDIQAMTSKLLTLLSNERLSTSIGEQARRKAVVALDVQQMIDSTLAVLKKVVSQP